MSSDKDVSFAILSSFFVGIVLGMFLCSLISNHKWEKEALQHNAAQYNPETGVFEWK